MAVKGRRPWTAVGRCLALVGLAAMGLSCSPAPEEARHARIGQMLDSTVQIFTEREGGGRRAGSAVVLAHGDGESQLLTTAHTLAPVVKQSVTVVAPPDRTPVTAQILALDLARDLALLSAPLPAGRAARLADGAHLVDPVWVAAFPWGRERTVIEGAVSQIAAPDAALERAPIWGPVQMIDASVSYGMSGGGVFDSTSGRLVGLVRGYRTAHLSLDSRSAPLKLPVAGETTVVSTRDIACFLRAEGRHGLVPDGLTVPSGTWPCH